MSMTGKEALTSILNMKPADRLCWTTLVDEVTCTIMPEDVRKLNPLEFYKYIGCDILQFGNYGINYLDFKVKYPYRFVMPETEETEYTDNRGCLVKKQTTQWGELVTKLKKGHPLKYPVESIEDLRIYKKLWLDSKYEVDEKGCADTYRNMDNAIGEQGIFVPTTQESPVQRLLEAIIGTEKFYYLLSDYPEEIEELLEIMHVARKQEYKIIAEKMPYIACIPVENTSTTYISPNIYRKYSLPQLRDYIDILHSGGKKCILHMCGLIRNLLGEIKETGADGIHALTPAPVGNTDYEYALDILGEQLVIIGIFNSALFHGEGVTRQELWDYLNYIYTPRLRKANFVLWPAVDGIPTPIERLLYVREWMEKYGIKE